MMMAQCSSLESTQMEIGHIAAFQTHVTLRPGPVGRNEILRILETSQVRQMLESL